jgi:dCMP deaminase
MGFARAAAGRSTCERKQVCAVIGVDRQVAVTGYNGSVRGMPHCDEVGHDMVDGHCVRTIHAEMNALAQGARRGLRLEGAWIYATASPCWACFRVLVNAGMQRFVFAEPYREDEHRASREHTGPRDSIALESQTPWQDVLGNGESPVQQQITISHDDEDRPYCNQRLSLSPLP